MEIDEIDAVPGLFFVDDVSAAAKETNFAKALGTDLFDGWCLSNEGILANCSSFLRQSLNSIEIKSYLKEA